ncbi:MAG: head GIN domain-containing protein [Bacteroidota bacterium]
MRICLLTAFVIFLNSHTVFAQWSNNYIELSPNITTKDHLISNFKKLDVGEDFEVFVKFGNVESIKIEANENLHDLIIVEKKGNTLKIDTQPYSTWAKGKRQRTNERLVAYITAKELVSIEGEEDVVIELDNRLETASLDIRLDEDATLSGAIKVKNLMVDLNEDSTLDLEGSAQKMELMANEDSMFKSYDFEVQDLIVELNEDSQAKITVNGTIDLEARGDSNFYYKGNAKIVRQRLRGDSQVKSWN